MKKPNKSTQRLILVMLVISMGGVAFAWYYYSQRNALVDPRVRPARELYAGYNRLAAQGEYDSVLMLMDRIEEIYQKHPHYRNGYETAVLYNNRSAAYLSKMLVATEEGMLSDSALFLDRAEENIRTALSLYNQWKEKMDPHTPRFRDTELLIDFANEPSEYLAETLPRYYPARKEELKEALDEYPRRLSVSLTNLGMIQRYRQDYDSAARCFIKATELWEENLTAGNNLNILLGKPLKKRNTLQKLFPPEK